ncbi:hypothetical protein ABH945_002962 [Paraburkholderia sp. GAS333]|uniref:UvrD-helicase domain-containing protein n=1 Tax=Paraburkholderia sp. GAS333 TaxID=3156279 RepID=UPI003D24AB9C
MKTITFDEKSISAASAGQIDLEPLFLELQLPLSDVATKCVRVGDHGYVLSRYFQPTDTLLTVSLEVDGPLTTLPDEGRHEAFGRLMRCTTMLVTGRTRSIPVSWRAFHNRNRLSFQADRLLRSADGGRTNSGRIVLELSQDEGQRVFAFLLDRTGTKDLAVYNPRIELHTEALSGIAGAIATPSRPLEAASLESSVTLDSDLPVKVRAQLTADEWYSTRLTEAQRQFVDHPLTSGVRLVGPAGTGKTVALVIKCIRELMKDKTQGGAKRFLFLTHAYKTAIDVETLVLGMEPDVGIELMAAEKPQLVITTLYALANRQMRYDLDDLTPVSLDGHAGREFQADVLNDVIDQYRTGDWIAYRSGCTTPFVSYMESKSDSMERRFFLWELLNEFACVLDAEGVRSGVERRSQYLAEKRRAWMMTLPTKEEREVVLGLYDGFRSSLRQMKAIGGDQMVTDFLNHLDSFRWEATRESEGFDGVFIDELHLFNRQERMVFRHLLRTQEGNPPVFMAYDAKQSPRDTFLKLPSEAAKQLDFWRDAKLGKVEKIELVDVFRYTPQIAKALSCIVQSFPGQDLDDDWPQYKGVSRIKDGPQPTICTVKSTVATYTTVFGRARTLQKELGRNGRVAVLCASNNLFGRYLEFTDLRDHFVAATSRDEASAKSPNSRKFLFSMPEFVAGLQFDTVLLIDVNQDEVPEGPYATAALRKFAGQVYLGASRAEQRLEMYASHEHGGPAALLSLAVFEKAVVTVDENGVEQV